MAPVAFLISAAAHTDYAALEVLATMLTTEPSGRLYQGLIKTKKATSVSAVAYGWHDPGVLPVMLPTDLEGRPLVASSSTLGPVAHVLMDRLSLGPLAA